MQTIAQTKLETGEERFLMSTNTANFIDPSRVSINKDRLEQLYGLVAEIYLADKRPWVIGYSGGKDSTAVVQVVWTSLSRLGRSKAIKPIFVIASDTLVETPVISNHITTTLKRINEASSKQSLPFSAHKVSPEVDDTFWVNLIGRGYPAPYNRFRWCTDRMKIKPATKFIYNQIADFGEVVLALGARKSESASRAQVMNNRRMVGEHLSRHCDIPGAWVITPIEDWNTEDVWTYLLNAPSPWGNSNRDLVTMYRNAQAGECPLVVDTTTPSCGNSRFGCWTCTVVDQDKSMEAMVDGGADWLEPMLDFRNWLAATQDPAGKSEIREHQRRSGRVEVFSKSNGERKIRWGPYKLEFRKQILRKLLETQNLVCRQGPNPNEELITKDELARIRQIWRLESGDWEDSLPSIYQEIIGEELKVSQDDWSGMAAAEKQILEDVARRHGLVPQLLSQLFDVEREQHGMSRRSQIYSRIDQVMSKDWLSRDEALLRLHVLDPELEESEDLKQCSSDE